jgi:hypothetical protein
MDQFGNRRVPNKVPGFTSFNSYSAGKKHYGSGRSMPNIGPVMGMQGYNERDNKAKARKSAILKRLKGQMGGNPMSPNIMLSDLKGG